MGRCVCISFGGCRRASRGAHRQMSRNWDRLLQARRPAEPATGCDQATQIDEPQEQRYWSWQETQEDWSWDAEPSKRAPRVTMTTPSTAHSRNDSPSHTGTGTLQERWEVALNPLRQFQHCHVNVGYGLFLDARES